MKPKNRFIIRELKKAKGHLGNTAMGLGVTYVTLWNWIKSDEELKLAKKEERMKRVGIAVDALMDKINQGDTTAIIFFLKTQCKDVIDEDFSTHKELSGGINIIAENAQINYNDKVKNLSIEQLRDLQNLLGAAEEEKICDVYTEEVGD